MPCLELGKFIQRITDLQANVDNFECDLEYNIIWRAGDQTEHRAQSCFKEYCNIRQKTCMTPYKRGLSSSPAGFWWDVPSLAYLELQKLRRWKKGVGIVVESH